MIEMFLALTAFFFVALIRRGEWPKMLVLSLVSAGLLVGIIKVRNLDPDQVIDALQQGSGYRLFQN